MILGNGQWPYFLYAHTLTLPWDRDIYLSYLDLTVVSSNFVGKFDPSFVVWGADDLSEADGVHGG